MRSERLLERFTQHCQADALTSEQMSRDIRDFGVEKLVHPTDILDPHDLERRLQQSR